MVANFYLKFHLGKHSTTTGGPIKTTTTSNHDNSSNTTTIVLVVLSIITVLIIIGAVVYTLYRKGYFGGREGLQRIRSIVNPGYGELQETGESVSTIYHKCVFASR